MTSIALPFINMFSPRQIGRCIAALSLFLLVTMAALGDDIAIDPRVQKSLQSTNRLPTDIRQDQRRRPDVVLSLLGVEPGMAVLDVFAGSGYYTELLSDLAGPEGTVHFHSSDIYERRLKVALNMRFTEGRLGNVVRNISELDDLTLAPASLDRALLALTYHDMYFMSARGQSVDREGFLRRLYAALKPGGRLVLVDHNAGKEAGSSMASRLHRIEDQTVIDDFAAFGFTLLERSKALENTADDHTKSVFDPSIRGKTDRFIFLFEKAG